MLYIKNLFQITFRLCLRSKKIGEVVTKLQLKNYLDSLNKTLYHLVIRKISVIGSTVAII